MEFHNFGQQTIQNRLKHHTEQQSLHLVANCFHHVIRTEAGTLHNRLVSACRRLHHIHNLLLVSAFKLHNQTSLNPIPAGLPADILDSSIRSIIPRRVDLPRSQSHASLFRFSQNANRVVILTEVRHRAFVFLIEQTLHRGRIRVIPFQPLFDLAQNRLSVRDFADHFQEETSFGAGGPVGGRDEEIVIEEVGRVESHLGDVSDGGVGRHVHEARERLEMREVGFGRFLDWNGGK